MFDEIMYVLKGLAAPAAWATFARSWGWQESGLIAAAMIIGYLIVTKSEYEKMVQDNQARRERSKN